MPDHQLTIEFHNVGPHEKRPDGTYPKVTFLPGVTRLCGRNAIGKSTAIEAGALAMGGEGDVTVTDGHSEGKVLVNGAVVLVLGKRTTRAGHPTVEIGNASAIGAVIEPNIKDPVKADQHRIKAVLSMAPVDVTLEVLNELVSGEAALTEKPLTFDESRNILAAADALRRRANEMALEDERAVQRAVGEADAWGTRLQQIPPPSGDAVPVETADAAYRRATTKHAQTRLLADQRKAAEERHARIAETHGERPDVAVADEKVTNQEKRLEDAMREVADLEARLNAARKVRDTAQADLAQARRDRATVHASAEQWDRHASALKEPITGPVAADVERAANDENVAAKMLADAEAHAEIKTLQDQIGTALAVSEQARERAVRLRKVAQGIADRLGEVLDRHGIAALSVEDGRLYATVDGKRQLFAERLSFGQKVRIALAIALKAYKARYIPLDGSWWAGLQPKFRREVHEIAVELGVYLVTEEATDDEEMRVLYGAEAA